MSAAAMEASCVRVFIWRACSSQTTGVESFVPSFGHVSLQTQLGGTSRYISFWPGNCNKHCFQKDPHYHTFEIDKLCEERPPVAPYVLKNLDIKKINDWFDAHKNDFSWVLRGSSILKGPNEFNCAGLSYRLLEEGGFNERLPKHVMVNIKRNIGFTVGFGLSAGLASYWFKYTISPLLKSVESSHQFANVVINMCMGPAKQ